MSEDTSNSSENTAAGDSTAEKAPAPVWQLISQYVRDLSFENPGAPLTVLGGTGAPKFDVNISVQVKRQSTEIYAVELTINSKAMREEQVLFNVELVYGGAFKVQNVPEQQLPALLMIESPRLIFPFARQVLANVTQAGGFPPLLMEPVDFAALYRRNLEALSKAQQQQDASAPN